MMRERDDTLMAEDDLREALRARRPDATRFRSTVERKISARSLPYDRVERCELSSERSEPSLAQSEPSLLARSPFLRRAAGMLPPGFFSDTALASGAGAATQWTFVKSLPAALLFPAALFVALVMTFLAAMGSLARLKVGPLFAAGREVSAARAEIRAWWRKHLLPAVLVIALMLITAFTAEARADVLLGAVLVSMLGLVLVLRRFSRARLATREQVGALCSQCLWTLFFWGLPFLSSFLITDQPSRGGVYIGALVLLAGSLACWKLGSSRHDRGETWVRAVIAATLAVFVVVCLWKRSGANVAELVEMAHWSPDHQHWPERSPFSELSLEEIASDVEYLRSSGVEVDLSEHRRWIETTLGRGAMPHPRDVDAFARMGIIDDAHWRMVLGSTRGRLDVEELLSSNGEPVDRFRDCDYAIRGLVATGALSSAQKEHVARRVRAAWPDGRLWGPLPEALRIGEILDVLGDSAWNEQRRADVYDLLRATWVTDPAPGHVADGFSEYLVRSHRAAHQTWIESTHAGVRLMKRFGIPSEIDLARVTAFLAYKTRRDFPWSDLHQRHILGALALREIDRDLPGQANSPVHMLFGERFLAAAALLAALCIQATLRAKRDDHASGLRSRPPLGPPLGPPLAAS